jgi:paraquat-inducible protein B
MQRLLLHLKNRFKMTEQKLPSPNIKRKKNINLAWVWLIPILAALIGIALVVKSINDQGPDIVIKFDSASGIEAGKTQIRFRDVVVGTVSEIRLSPDRNSVLVKAQLTKDAESLASSGTTFWVVKPRIGLGGVSGLSTILSGSFIEADIKVDPKTGEKANHSYESSFVGLEVPPPINSDRAGRAFIIRSPTLGSLEPGAPIYYRKIPVGVVTEYKLDTNGQYVDISVFIYKPYDDYVTGSTRFWDESGINVTLGASGVEVKTASLLSLLAGGLGFEPFDALDNQPAKAGTVFNLYETRKAAELVPIGIAIPVVFHFEQTTRGLVKNAPINFRGVDIGVINDVVLEIVEREGTFFSKVSGTIYPERIGNIYSQLPNKFRTQEFISNRMFGLIKRGMRAQLQTGNILTGQLFVSIVFDNDSTVKLPENADLPLLIPTVVTEDFGHMQKQITSILKKLDKIPYEEIGKEVKDSLIVISAATKDFNETLDNLNLLISPNSPLTMQLNQSLKELDRTIRATRGLIDNLRDKPNAIIFGDGDLNYSRENLGGQ